MKENKPYDSSLVGFIYGIAAYVLWGFLPLYWKLLDKIPATEILAHRILWSFMFVCTILYFNGNLHKCKEVFKDKLNIIRISCATVFITINWGTYIWAVNSDHIVEASMGYYMNPLIVVVLGVVILKERLNTWQIVSLIMATIGVSIVTISYGQIPWISLILALSFGLYGLMKKMIPVGSTVSLAIETAMLMPLILIYIIFRQVSGIGALGNISAATTFILIG
ncbi:MAG: protein RarD, partial [Clostridiales bacterium]|nr:protein RarD [Clostridiales bacterium]